MNNFKKIGLTALAASLVSTSVFAGELAVTGSASMKVAHVDEGTASATVGHTGKAFTMGNSVNFAGSGELDNGLSVSIAFELDEANASTDTFDNHSVTVSSDAIGSLTCWTRWSKCTISCKRCNRTNLGLPRYFSRSPRNC
jgi:outer membrane protein OmpU